MAVSRSNQACVRRRCWRRRRKKSFDSASRSGILDKPCFRLIYFARENPQILVYAVAGMAGFARLGGGATIGFEFPSMILVTRNEAWK